MKARYLWRKLDSLGFLNYRAWEFSAYSLLQTYGHTFLRRVVLRHPWRTLQGLAAYRRLMPLLKEDDGFLPLFPSAKEAFLRQAAGQEPGRFLVALGFCQKQTASGSPGGGCPAGRFNHDCLALRKTRLRGNKGPVKTPAMSTAIVPPDAPIINGSPIGPETGNAACTHCDIPFIAKHALAAGAGLYIMTTAQDIALDLLVPSLENGRFRQVLMFLCPMSVQAIILPLLICGLSGFLVSYDWGYCDNYARWLRADRGYKPEQTGLKPSRLQRAVSLLDQLAEERRRLGGPSTFSWQRAGNMYMPVATYNSERGTP